MKKPIQTGAEKLVSDALAIYDVADSLEMSGERNMATFLRNKLDDILSFAYSLDKTSKTEELITDVKTTITCLLYTSPSPRDRQKSRMPSSA